MSIVKTSEEFSSRRKVRYGTGSESKPLTPSTTNASLSPHKTHYGKDQDGQEAYFIEFNIGDFDFKEITIRTEGRRLIVTGKSKLAQTAEEFSREFKRDFTLPANVDQYSIAAQLDEERQQLMLIGKVVHEPENVQKQTYNSTTSAEYASSSFSAKIGSIKENNTGKSFDYEIFLGNDLKDGQTTIEITGYNVLVVRVIKNDWDRNGDFSYELKRQIKLPAGANPQNIEHGIDKRTATLLVKVPAK
uniref:Hsp30 n=1 Tax=Brachionus ibericus TaxID=183141 RepID=H6S168_9BILA|nr:Hsp30 [Brachionus ibericus]